LIWPHGADTQWDNFFFVCSIFFLSQLKTQNNRFLVGNQRYLNLLSGYWNYYCGLYLKTKKDQHTKVIIIIIIIIGK